MKLIPVKYHNKNYPEGVIPQLDEIAGNLDSKAISARRPYSLHTEYSYMKRKFDSELLRDLDELKSAHKDGIPQLWKNVKWSEEYAVFIERLIGDSVPPEVIEIHPPFRDYCNDLAAFWERYIVFYKYIIKKYPKTKIIIENRCGTMYTGSGFLISTCNDVLELCRFLTDSHTELGVIVDYPQLFSAEKIKMDNVKLDKILRFNTEIKPYVSIVQAIHLWGKRKSKKSNRWSPHSGDLNTFFSNDNVKKAVFLESMKDLFHDDIKRYFVPEVNTSEDDLKSIVSDLTAAGIIFVQTDMEDYLVSIDWDEQVPRFILCNHVQNSIWKCNAIGEFSFLVGPKRYCIGNKEITSHEYSGCPNHAMLTEKSNKCPDCDRSDRFKNCVKCTGNYCYVKDREVLNRCNQEHFVYLAYFPGDIIKVGVAHGRRKYARLFEQGALYSFIIASCPSGKIARKLESDIRKTGVRDKVSSQYKVNNLTHFKVAYANKKLSETYNYIMSELDNISFKDVGIIDPPEIVEQKEALSVLEKLSFQENQQLTLWDYMDIEKYNRKEIKMLESLNNFRGQIVSFIGTIAILRQEEKYFLFDFKQVIGREIRLIKNKE